MNRAAVCFFSLLLGYAGTCGARADAPEPFGKSICVDVQIVSVSPVVALELVPLFGDENTAGAANERLQKMIGDGEATLLGWPRVWLHSGEKAFSETISECRYPCLDFSFGCSGLGGGLEFRKPSNVRPGWGPWVPPTFETRNTGDSLEASAILSSDGRKIDIEVVCGLVRLAGFARYLNQPSNLGASGMADEPRFLSNKVSASFTVLNRRPALLGVFVMSKPDPHVEMFVLKATWALPASAPHAISR